MGTVTRRRGKLVLDFRYRGHRCRERTALPDTAANRRQQQMRLGQIEAQIRLGSFNYLEAFPESRLAARLAASGAITAEAGAVQTFERFARQWQAELEAGWRPSYAATIQSILSAQLLPYLGTFRLAELDRARVMAFRAVLLRPVAGRPLAPATINRIMAVLRAILQEASLRFGLPNPADGIRRLRTAHAGVQVFRHEEVRRIIAAAPIHWRDYLTVRFYAGLRSGELSALTWRDVDLQRRQLSVRATRGAHGLGLPKTQASCRDVQIGEQVERALRTRRAAAASEWVFCDESGQPVDNRRFTEKVWRPLLAQLGLSYQRPYVTRHCAATFWLAAGENPSWIARQLGHTDVTMVCRIYARYMPHPIVADGERAEQLMRDISEE